MRKKIIENEETTQKIFNLLNSNEWPLAADPTQICDETSNTDKIERAQGIIEVCVNKNLKEHQIVKGNEDVTRPGTKFDKNLKMFVDTDLYYRYNIEYGSPLIDKTILTVTSVSKGSFQDLILNSSNKDLLINNEKK